MGAKYKYIGTDLVLTVRYLAKKAADKSIAFWSGVALAGKATKRLLPAEQQALQNKHQSQFANIMGY